ncbi:MAG: nucleoside-diphosphate kinase [Gammaproteobacteria bacterium]|nr:nucleoside-diphosphate kinase [Gammaproteobacteria bacterium]
MERSLVVMKPDAMRRGLAGEIISRFETVGLKIVAAKVLTPSVKMLEDHYQIDKLAPIVGQKSKDAGTDVGDDVAAFGRMIVGWTIDYVRSAPVLAIVFEGLDGTIPRIRKMAGFTDPSSAEPGTIRGDLGQDSINNANNEKRGVDNLMHASGDAEEAAHEINLWFPELKASDAKAA